MGVILLFKFALPNHVIGEPSVLTGDGPLGWEKRQQHYNTYADLGLALVVAGTFMEAVPPLCTAIGSARRRHRAFSSAGNKHRRRNQMQELLDMFADGSGFGDRDARRNAEQQLQVALAKEQQRIGNRLNWLTLFNVVVGLLNAAVLAFQVWHR
jgi:hypothetical protein